MERGSGILLHISSLPSPYGIGTLGRAAYEFIDFLKRAGQKYWQILPISPTGFGDSPYQSYSTFAGNPYFIDLDTLSEDGKLDPDVYRNIKWCDNPEYADYGRLFAHRISVLKQAYKADIDDLREELIDFRSQKSYWIENYALFMALKYKYDLKPYTEWPDDIKIRNSEAMVSAYNELCDEIEFWIYVQYRFFEQWERLKEYAEKQGIKIIGDIPIYVAEDSADAWAHNEILQLDEVRKPINVAGCPPDYFSPKGQLWGNPLYDWDFLKSTGYEWWIERIKSALSLFDVVRIDHFRAFANYFSIPFGAEDATGGKWEIGPGTDFFDTLKRELGTAPPIIAEDLGMIDRPVRELSAYTGFPGMKVLQFAFDPDCSSEYIPHKFNKNCVAYLGTHDNDTIAGWLETVDDKTLAFAREYMRLNDTENDIIGIIKTLMASVADVSIITMQDILGLGSKARMNIPSEPCGNWQWRLTLNWVFFDETADWIQKITKTYGRC